MGIITIAEKEARKLEVINNLKGEALFFVDFVVRIPTVKLRMLFQLVSSEKDLDIYKSVLNKVVRELFPTVSFNEVEYILLAGSSDCSKLGWLDKNFVSVFYSPQAFTCEFEWSELKSLLDI